MPTVKQLVLLKCHVLGLSSWQGYSPELGCLGILYVVYPMNCMQHTGCPVHHAENLMSSKDITAFKNGIWRHHAVAYIKVTVALYQSILGKNIRVTLHHRGKNTCNLQKLHQIFQRKVANTFWNKTLSWFSQTHVVVNTIITSVCLTKGTCADQQRKKG